MYTGTPPHDDEGGADDLDEFEEEDVRGPTSARLKRLLNRRCAGVGAGLDTPRDVNNNADRPSEEEGGNDDTRAKVEVLLLPPANTTSRDWEQRCPTEGQRVPRIRSMARER
jgi:hypothetical protein